MKKKSTKILLCIVFVILVFIIIIYVKRWKNDNIYKNSFYNENLNKITNEDFSIGNISLNMSMYDVKNLLGEPEDVSEFVDSENPEISYKRFDYDNLIIQFDYEKEYVNYIASSQKEVKNHRKIGVDSTVTDVLKAYYSNPKIEIYEDSYGVYEILYGKDDATKYLNDLSTENKNFSYIYKYNDDINSIIFVEEGKVIEFYLTENKINMMIVADKYIPW